MGIIVNSGNAYLAEKQAASEPIVIKNFVYANVPGIDETNAVNPDERWPDSEHIVHEQAVDRAGYIASDKLVYSSLLTSSQGDFTFNWIGLKTDDDRLYSVTYVPLTQKIKSIPALAGNTLVRSFLLQWDGALNDTHITISASTWQLDFTGWLESIGEHARLANHDIYGDQAFLGDGWKVVNDNGEIKLKAGAGYIGGIRIENKNDQLLSPGMLPKDVWLEVSLQSDISGVAADVQIHFEDIAPMPGKDNAGREHYCCKIASINAAGLVTDKRQLIEPAPSLITAIKHWITEQGRQLTDSLDSLRSDIEQRLQTINEALSQCIRVDDIEDSVNSSETDKVLSANQGKLLSTAIDNINWATLKNKPEDFPPKEHSHRFRGALVKSIQHQTIRALEYIDISFSVEEYDTDSIRQNNTYLEVPAGVNKVRIIAQAQINGGTGWRQLYVYKNDSRWSLAGECIQHALTGTSLKNTLQISSPVLLVNAGDRISFRAYSSQQVNVLSYSTWAAVEVIE